MTTSRVKENVDKIFECYLQIENINGNKKITCKYPENFSNTDILNNVPVFCFPVDSVEAGDYFSFTITNSLESMFSFGYCVTTTPTSVACIVSYLPWHNVFYTLMKALEKTLKKAGGNINPHSVLGNLHRHPVPGAGPFTFDVGSMRGYKVQVPDHQGLVTVNDNRNMGQLLGLLNKQCIYTLYMALMMERRIILLSDNLDTLSACVYAARDLIYPLYWQHVFIPVLPAGLIDYVAAPMPLLIGLHRSLEERARRTWGEELVLVDMDKDEMQVPPSLLSEDMQRVPHGIEESVCEGIKGIKKLYDAPETKDRVGNKLAKMFCVTLVAIVGNYRGSCRFDNTKSKKFSFDHDHFLHSRPQNLQECVSKLLQCQHFDEFIQERLQITQGLKPRDAYEELAVSYYQTGSNKNYLKTWINDEIFKELNPQLAMIQNGAFAFQGLMSDINSGTKVSSPRISKDAGVGQRTAPTRPTPWHQYKNTLLNLPAFLRDSSVPPPTIDDKLFNLLIGNLEQVASNPSTVSPPDFVRTHSIQRKPGPPTSRPPRPNSTYSATSRNTPVLPSEVNVGQLISLDDDK